MVTLFYITQMSKKLTEQKQKSEFREYYKTLLKADRTTHFTQKSERNVKCRVCLQAGRVPILDNANGAVRDMLAAVTSIEVDKNDELPKRVCAVCYKFLKVAIQFRALAKRTAKELMLYKSAEQEPPGICESAVNFSMKLEPPRNTTDTIEIAAQPEIDFCTSRITSDNSSGSFKSITLNRDINYICEYCDKLFNSQLALDNHQCVHDNSPQESHKTSKNIVENNVVKSVSNSTITCGKLVKNKNTSHLKPEIDYTKTFIMPGYNEGRIPEKVTCKICKTTIKYQCMKSHYFYKHDPNAPDHICEYCGKIVKNKYHLFRHMNIHVNNFPYNCKMCPYKGRNAGCLYSHMFSHRNTYKFMCDHCPSKFKRRVNIIRHLRIHQKPNHSCSMCSRAFHTKSLLKEHFDSIHLGIKNFICSLCGVHFGQKKMLRAHEKNVHKRPKIFPSRKPNYMTAEAQDQD